ncbi:MAG: SusC/RagA family TonB-linked outer membrane protein [Bergeyella sp.]|nr:SusC/RagA family TonB-linked outer membrane protein [Bergeyella sp.]
MNTTAKIILAMAICSPLGWYYGQEKKDSVKTSDIQEVVVTALGIKREKKALGYSTQEVKAEDLAKTPTQNFTSGLSGKVSGLQIKSMGNFGGSVDIVLRGYRSITGTNSPLFVIDGIPMLDVNNNTEYQANGYAGYDFGNTISDINPNDIQEINVLKGAAATALYGSRAQNGAVIITTKKGKRSKRIGIDFQSTLAISAIDKSTFAQYQKQYGQGYGYFYGKNGDQQFADYKNGNDLAPTSEDASYGARFDPNLNIWQYNAFIPGSSNFGKATPWVAAKNDPSKFFETGVMLTNGVSFSGGGEKSTFRLSYQNQNGTDVLPNSFFNKNNFNGNASYKLTEDLVASFGTTYVSQQVKGRNSTGYSGNLISGFRQWWATNVDIYEQRNLYNLSQQNYSWNIKSPTNLSPAYWNNPYFQRYQNYSYDTRDRLAGNVSLNYNLNPKINLLARAGTDGYSAMMEVRKAAGSIPGLLGFGLTKLVDQPSGYAVKNIRQRETNYDFIATYKDKFKDFDFNGILGTNVRIQEYYSNSQSTSGGLLVPGIYTISNSVSNPPLPKIINTKKKVVGVFGQASVGFLKTYYLEGNLRRDQSSALAPGNDAYWYYSASTSILFSNWNLISKDVLSFGKFRASYAEVGSDTNANLLRNVYDANIAVGNSSSNSFNTIARTFGLRPERSKQTEIGINTQFLRNKIGLDLAWFQNDAYDQILSLPVSYATGVERMYKNVGNLRTRGLEIALSATPVKAVNFRWDVNVNWSNPITSVTRLSSGVENITMGSYQGGITINASLGDLYGTIKGSDYVYTNGQKTVGENGKYLTTNTNSVIGNMQAKWYGGITNTFKYKNYSFSFLVDVRYGGNVFSLDQYYGQATGLYPETAGNNHLGNPVRNPISEGGGIILPGVNTEGTPNTKRIDASSFGAMGYRAYPASQFVYDASFVKLRQISVNYTLPTSLIKNTLVKSISFGVVANNLWIIYKKVPYADPEAGLSSGNTQGYQSGVMPTTRVFSFTLKASF